MRLVNVGRVALNLAGVRLRRASRHWRTVVREWDRLGRKASRQQEMIARAPSLVRARVEHQRAALERSRKRVERFGEHVAAPCYSELSIKRQLARAASSDRPLIVGPWTSEVGYEALYWLPFLHWAVDRYGVSPDRVIALSRGGTRSWYSGIANRYVEIFDIIEPREFAAQAARRREAGDQKQLAASEFDRSLIAQGSSRLGISDAVTWHPGLMYQLFRPFWYGDRSLDFLFRHAAFDRVRRSLAGAPRDPSLPTEYAAVKFYSGPALPDSTRNRDTLYEFVQRLTRRMPVVLLDTAWSVDEHHDYTVDTMPGVTTLRPSLDPRTNLGVQTAVIAGARLFVGTCGGLAWLAPLLGVETLAVYEDDRYLTAHLYAARYAYRRTGAAGFSVVNVKGLRRLENLSEN
jgi:hypothetical protein